jgi:hypothetical protein
LVYDKIAGTVDQQMVKAFGDFTEPARQEMARFARQEGYIKGLQETYAMLISNTEQEIACLEQSATKHLELLINQRQLHELCEPTKEVVPDNIDTFEHVADKDEHPWSMIAENQRLTAR